MELIGQFDNIALKGNELSSMVQKGHDSMESTQEAINNQDTSLRFGLIAIAKVYNKNQKCMFASIKSNFISSAINVWYE